MGIQRKVLVTNSSDDPGLTAIRCLGREGFAVRASALNSARPPMGFWSKYATETCWSEEYSLAEMLTAARGCDGILPVNAHTIRVVLEHPDEFSPFASYLPSLELFDRVNDKATLMSFAESKGFLAPKNYYFKDMDDLKEQLPKIRFPLVVKFRHDNDLYLLPKERYAIVRDAGEFPAVYQAFDAKQKNPVVQDYIQGDGYGASFIMNDAGETVLCFAHRRIREYPASGGPSTAWVSYKDPALLNAGESLLRALNWRGVAMVEFKKDIRDGNYVLMEINPRLWGSVELSARLGLNFPATLMKLAFGLPVTPVLDFPHGKKMRFLFEDMKACIAYAKCGKWGRSAGFFRDLLNPTIRPAIFSLGDPKPFFSKFFRPPWYRAR